MNKPKIICIIGKTCTGKDTLTRFLYTHFNISHIVSYTTRPKRDSETNGKEHHFITEDEYKRVYANKDKLAYTEINGYKYFTTKDQVPVEGKVAYVIDPNGYKDLYNNYSNDFDFIVVYIKADYETRKARYESREQNISIPFEDRSSAEYVQFDTFEKDKRIHKDFVIDSSRLDFREDI